MILLDSHVLLWLLLDPDRITPTAAAAIGSSKRGSLFVSALSLYETARAIHRGRIETTVSAEAFLQQVESWVSVSQITSRIAVVAAQLPPTFPSDPFDRIIAATALVEGIPLVTADQRIRESGAVPTIW